MPPRAKTNEATKGDARLGLAVAEAAGLTTREPEGVLVRQIEMISMGFGKG